MLSSTANKSEDTPIHRQSPTMEICRICRLQQMPGDSAGQEPLRAPCLCSGSMKYVHPSCLLEWITYSKSEHCHVCKQKYIITRTYKPLSALAIIKWIFRTAAQLTTYSLVGALWFVVFPVVVNMVFEFYHVTAGSFFVWLNLMSEYRMQRSLATDALHEYLESEAVEMVRVSEVMKAFVSTYLWGIFQMLLVVGCGLSMMLLRDSIGDYMEVRRIAQLNQLQNQGPAENEAAPPPLEPMAPLAPARIIQQQQREVEELPFFDGLPAFNREPDDNPLGQQLVERAPAAERDQENDGDVLAIFGFRGDLMAAVKSVSGFTAILFILLGFLEHVPRQLGSLVLGDDANDGFGSWRSLVTGYLIVFTALLAFYITHGRHRSVYRLEFGALFLSLKLILMFSIEILVFPWLIGTVILWPLSLQNYSFIKS